MILAYRGNSQNKAQNEADLLEAREREIMRGWRPIPTPEVRADARYYREIVEEYLAWGNAQGGLGGSPWTRNHARGKQVHLAWWGEKLGLQNIMDLMGILPRVEEALRELLKNGRGADNGQPGEGVATSNAGRPLTGKTANEIAGSLKSLCGWAALPARGYLPNNPLTGLRAFDATPKVPRRVVSPEEIVAMLDAAPPHHQVLLEVAPLTGIRKAALRSLTPDHFDPESMTLRIDPKFAKNRKLTFKRVPQHLREPLLAFIQSGEAKRLYEFHNAGRKGGKGPTLPIPENPLLFVPTHVSRTLAGIAKVAGVPLVTPEGKFDFHAYRTTYINMVEEEGGDFKVTQELADHAPGSTVTSRSYLKARASRLAATVEAIGAKVVALKKSGQSVADQPPAK
jgi:integrase